jgi:DNA-directed RNA polymerase specialized sigma24 family protein
MRRAGGGALSTLAYADSQNPDLLRHYEGLIYRTAQLTAPLVEDDFDDICQVLRIKVWRALHAWDPKRAPKLVAKYGEAKARDRSIFAWVKNQQKDLIKKKRRGEISLDGLKGRQLTSQFEDGAEFAMGEFLPDETDPYAQVDDEPPLIPSTLLHAELRVLCLLYSDYRQSEVAVLLEIPKRDVERLVRSIRLKMADWAPSAAAIAADEDYPETRIAA